jgi:hypothetical protein
LTERQEFRVWVAIPAQLHLEVVSVDRQALMPLVLVSSQPSSTHNLGMNILHIFNY